MGSPVQGHGVGEITRTLLARALEVYAGSPRATNWLRGHLARFDEPVRVAVVGPASAGKSTLVDALVGGEVATGAARAEPGGQAWYQVPRTRSQPELTLIDTPAVGPDTAKSVVEGICMEADAVLCLMAHPHGADLAFLQTVHDHPVARAAPVSALVVLSRADEFGGGRVDALISARHAARRVRKEGQLSGLCQDVVPVAGLAARGARIMSEADFATLSALAAAPKEDLDAVLLSADRFAADPARAGLLDRFGLFGVRLAARLVAQGAASQPALVTQLAQRSGLSELRDTIALYLTDRSPVLKARSALLGLDVVLRNEPRPAAAGLLAEVERTLAGAHEFRELRLLAALRTGRVAFPDELREEAVRLIGGYGTDPPARLGMEAAEPELRETAAGALRLWQEYAVNPVFGAAERRAAAAVVRSCEAMVTAPTLVRAGGR